MSYQMERILEFLGEAVYEEQDVINEFGGKSVDEIRAKLDEVYIYDDNRNLAQMIFDELEQRKYRI